MDTGFLNRVSEVRFLPGARCDVSGHRGRMSRAIVDTLSPQGLVVAAGVQCEVTQELSLL
jgi:hypothetical protein